MTTIYVQVPLPVAYEWMITSPVERVEKLSRLLGVTLSQETEITQLLKGAIEENGSKEWDCVHDCYSVMTGQFVIDADRTSMISCCLLNVSKHPDVTVWVKIINSGYVEAIEAAMMAKEQKQAIAEEVITPVLVLVIEPVVKALEENGFDNPFLEFSRWFDVNSSYMNLSVLAKILSRHSRRGDTDQMIEVILDQFAKQQRSIGEKNALERLQDQVVNPDLLENKAYEKGYKQAITDKAYEKGYKQAIADVVEEYESYDQLSSEEGLDLQCLTDALADIKETVATLVGELEEAEEKLSEVQENVDEICQQGSDFSGFLDRKRREHKKSDR